MRCGYALLLPALLAFAGGPSAARAQWQPRRYEARGLFGPRELGGPLKPKRSRFGSGLQRGPSGNLIGRSNADRGLTFRARQPSPPQIRSAVPLEGYNFGPAQVPSFLEQQYAAGQRAAGQQLPGAPVQPSRQQQALEQLQGQAPPSAQPQPPQPDRWFRGSPPAVPDRWFRGPPPAQPQAGRAAMPPSLGPAATTGPTGTLGPSGQYAPGPAGSRNAANSLGARITRYLGPRVRTPLSVAVRGDAATVTGVVATEADRQVVEQMVLLEPGIRKVDNRVSGAGQPAPPARPRP